jgi:hypothetical protein
MEIVDNLVMAIIPGAMDSGLVNPIFWLGMMIALTAAFIAAFPVNRYLIDKGKGHALTRQFMHGDAHDENGHADTGNAHDSGTTHGAHHDHSQHEHTSHAGYDDAGSGEPTAGPGHPHPHG